jgi:GxxExxY protein
MLFLQDEQDVIGALSVLLYEELTSVIIGKSYEVMNELGAGFLESVYHKSLFLALQQEGLRIQFEYPIAVLFRGHNVGNFKLLVWYIQKW